MNQTPPPFPKKAGPVKSNSVAKVVGIIFGIIVLLAIIGAMSGPEEHSTASAPAAATAAPATAPAAVEVYETTAEGLNSDYDRNEVATDLKIGNRVVQVTGRVQSIDKDFMDDIVVQLAAGNEFMPASMTMEKTETSKAAALSKGDHVTIRCEKMRRIMDSPAGSDCVLVGG